MIILDIFQFFLSLHCFKFYNVLEICKVSYCIFFYHFVIFSLVSYLLCFVFQGFKYVCSSFYSPGFIVKSINLQFLLFFSSCPSILNFWTNVGNSFPKLSQYLVFIISSSLMMLIFGTIYVLQKKNLFCQSFAQSISFKTKFCFGMKTWSSTCDKEFEGSWFQ